MRCECEHQSITRFDTKIGGVQAFVPNFRRHFQEIDRAGPLLWTKAMPQYVKVSRISVDSYSERVANKK